MDYQKLVTLLKTSPVAFGLTSTVVLLLLGYFSWVLLHRKAVGSRKSSPKKKKRASGKKSDTETPEVTQPAKPATNDGSNSKVEKKIKSENKTSDASARKSDDRSKKPERTTPVPQSVPKPKSTTVASPGADENNWITVDKKDNKGKKQSGKKSDLNKKQSGSHSSGSSDAVNQITSSKPAASAPNHTELEDDTEEWQEVRFVRKGGKFKK